MPVFADDHERVRFAKKFLLDRTDSLQSDVRVCLTNGTAAFPAILYCFSTVDLLGALLAGHAKKGSDTTGNAMEYAKEFMHYSQDHCELLWGLFRHKTVHLAQPKASVMFKNIKTTWLYVHNDDRHHLKLVPLHLSEKIPFSSITIEAEQCFQISISHFVMDIVNSVHEAGGYLDTLASDVNLQGKFDKAVEEIYDPKQK